MFREASPLWTEPDDGSHHGVRLWHYFGVKANIDGDDVIVRLAAREMDNGEIHLLHYDADVRSIADVEKVMAGRLFDPNQNHPSATTADVSTDKDSLVNWLSSVKPTDSASQHYQVKPTLFNQSEQNRGSFNPTTNTIALLKNAVKEMFREASPLWTEPDDGSHHGVRLWHYFGVKANIDGEDVIVRLAAREMDDGTIHLLHYDADIRDVADVEKAMAGGLSTPMQSHPSATAADLSTSRDSLVNWLSSVKPTDSASQHYQVKTTLFNQSEQNRGSFNPTTNTIALLKNADLSTFLHESGHYFLEVMGDIAAQPNAPTQIKQDMDELLKWF